MTFDGANLLVEEVCLMLFGSWTKKNPETAVRKQLGIDGHEFPLAGLYLAPNYSFGDGVYYRTPYQNCNAPIGEDERLTLVSYGREFAERKIKVWARCILATADEADYYWEIGYSTLPETHKTLTVHDFKVSVYCLIAELNEFLAGERNYDFLSEIRDMAAVYGVFVYKNGDMIKAEGFGVKCQIVASSPSWQINLANKIKFIAAQPLVGEVAELALKNGYVIELSEDRLFFKVPKFLRGAYLQKMCELYANKKDMPRKVKWLPVTRRNLTCLIAVLSEISLSPDEDPAEADSTAEVACETDVDG